ncbi:MAG: flagellar biosynthesis protein FlgF [Alishewanella sp. 34-51-39]|nr:MAG: flagellar biosynthesis protein FlgF [Alishewanella sp. 34-51-39]
MDRLLYIAMSGAKENMHGISVRANNLANTGTVGFKADFEQARSMQAFGAGLPTRVFSMTERPGQNFDSGALIITERELDMAIQGDGWFAVQDKDGNEAYTRAGNMQLSPTGMLLTASGLPVLGDDGPIQLPVPLAKIEIGQDGTVSARVQGAPANVLDVNAIGEMTSMISLQRQFELQVKMMKQAEQMDQQQNQLLRIIG